MTGAGLVGSTVMANPASAHDPDDNGPIPVFPTWGDHEVWELVDAEPPSRDRLQDAEGTHDNAMAPLYIIKAIDGGSHSPMVFGFDVVVPVPGGTARRQYSAQWHPHIVIEEGAAPDFANLVNVDQNDDPLTSATAIQEAENVDTPGLPLETAFTCPVRPHHD